MKIKILLLTILLLAFIGFLDSTYLSILHYKNAFPPCLVAQNCERVLTSQYSTIGTLPVSVLGSAFYVLVIIFSILILENSFWKISTNHFLIALVLLGFLVSLYFFFIQAFVLHAFCQYCLLSEGISLLILILSLKLVRFKLEVRS